MLVRDAGQTSRVPLALATVHDGWTLLRGADEEARFTGASGGFVRVHPSDRARYNLTIVPLSSTSAELIVRDTTGGRTVAQLRGVREVAIGGGGPAAPSDVAPESFAIVHGARLVHVPTHKVPRAKRGDGVEITSLVASELGISPKSIAVVSVRTASHASSEARKWAGGDTLVRLRRNRRGLLIASARRGQTSSEQRGVTQIDVQMRPTE